MESRVRNRWTVAIASLLLACGVGAQPPAESEGVVRKVDRKMGKVTLRHGQIQNLDMPPMTMVFTVPEPKLLEGLKQGDKVRFVADQKDGTYIVSRIRVAK